MSVDDVEKVVRFDLHNACFHVEGCLFKQSEHFPQRSPVSLGTSRLFAMSREADFFNSLSFASSQHFKRNVLAARWADALLLARVLSHSCPG